MSTRRWPTDPPGWPPPGVPEEVLDVGCSPGPAHYEQAEKWLGMAADPRQDEMFRMMCAVAGAGHAMLAQAAATAARITEFRSLPGIAEKQWIDAGIIPDYPPEDR